MSKQIRTYPNSTIQICISKFFLEEKCDNETKYRCSLCNKLYSGKQRSNLPIHIKTVHKEDYDSVFGVNEKQKQELSVLRLQKIHSFVKIVAINMRPFACLNDSGFLEAIETDLSKFRDAGMPILMNKNHTEVKDAIIKLATDIQTQIKEEVHNRLVSMMVDIATRHQRSILGVKIRFSVNENPVERIIGMVRLMKSHNAAYVSDQILKCIESFEMRPLQIISLTTDNASNMKAAIKRFDKAVAALNNVDENDTVIESDSDQDESDEQPRQESVEELLQFLEEDLTSEEYANMLSELRDEEALDDALDDTEVFQDLLTELEGEMNKRTNFVFDIRCAAHTIQLAVKDAVKKSNIQTILDACQSVAKSLRNQKFICAAAEQKITYIYPRLRCKIRWDTEYKLVSLCK